MRGGTPPSYFVMTWMAAERGVMFFFNNVSYFFVIKWLTKRNIFVFKNVCKLHILSWKLQNCGYWDLSLLCINLKINLIFILSPEKCIQFNQSRTDNQLSGNLKYCVPFYERTLICWNMIGIFIEREKGGFIAGN